jgi:Flp pilus assembly CpaE family ATPase
MTKDTILIIENDLITNKWLSTFLSKNGYDVNTASLGREALDLVTSKIPDLVILDLNLPDISGEQVVESIIQNPITSKIPIVVLTSKGDSQEVSRLFEKGIAHFIVKKPGIESELLGACTSCLSRARRTNSLISKGRLISFFSAKGGNGTSILCINMAQILARQVLPKTVLVVDMVLPLGSLGIVTGSQRGNSIAALTTEGGPYPISKIKKYIVQAKEWNFSLLQGSYNPYDAGTLIPDEIAPLFDSLQLAFNYVIVDLGKTLSRISLPILKGSERVVIVLGPDPVTVELTKETLEYMVENGIKKDRLVLVMNRAVGREGLTRSEIEKSLNMPIQGTIPYVGDNFNLASNQHIPYADRFPKDSATIVLNDLASLLRIIEAK